eukprot:2815107-Rhodomonas_salina.1
MAEAAGDIEPSLSQIETISDSEPSQPMDTNTHVLPMDFKSKFKEEYQHLTEGNHCVIWIPEEDMY